MFTIIVAVMAATTLAQIFDLPSSNAPSPTGFQSNLEAQLFIDGNSPTGFAASVVCANPSEVTYVLECQETSRPNALCQLDSRVALTITARPTDYEMLYESVVPRRGSATVTQSCVLNGPSPSFTQAVCSLSAWFAVGGRSAQLTSTVETVAQTDIPAKATLPVTAGATNIASTCASNPSTTSSTTTSNQMAPTVGGTQTSVDAAPTAAVYKVLIPIGAAAMGLVLL